jgi:hypothetical protein
MTMASRSHFIRFGVFDTSAPAGRRGGPGRVGRGRVGGRPAGGLVEPGRAEVRALGRAVGRVLVVVVLEGRRGFIGADEAALRALGRALVLVGAVRVDPVRPGALRVVVFALLRRGSEPPAGRRGGEVIDITVLRPG